MTLYRHLPRSARFPLPALMAVPCALSLAGSLLQAAAPVAVNDEYGMTENVAVTVSAGAGVVANDHRNGLAVEAVVVDPPATGMLEMNPDGGFRYTPAPDVSGTVTFSYKLRTVVGPVRFTIDQAQSRLQVEARATTEYGSATDRDDSRVSGTLRARLTPSASPFLTAQVTELDARLVDPLDLSLRFGCIFGFCLATVDVSTRTAEPDWLTLSMVEAGPEAPVVTGEFSQLGNSFALAGTADIAGTGLAAELIPSGVQSLDTTAVIDLANIQINSANGTITLRAPILYSGTFYLDPEVTTTNSIELTARSAFTGSSGFLVATAPASANVPEESGVATVTFVIAEANDDKDADGISDEWEVANGLDPADPTDATLDIDGDGADNRSEFLAGTDPRSATSVLAVGSMALKDDTLTLTCSGLVSGRRYRLEQTGQFNGWSPAGEDFIAIDNIQEIRVPIPSTTRFFRLHCLTTWP